MDVGGLIALTMILIVVIPIAILIVIDKIRERKSNWTKEEKMIDYGIKHDDDDQLSHVAIAKKSIEEDLDEMIHDITGKYR